MSTVAVRRVSGAELLARQDDILHVYAEAFAEAPWNASRQVAERFLGGLAERAYRPGFVAALGFDGERVSGFATACTTPAPFPSGGCYPQVAAALGPEHTASWLCGGREVDELAVAKAARGRGVGTALLDAVTADAPEGRCWLLTSVRARDALAFYRRLRWTQATHPAAEGTGHAVFLGPLHPARTAAPRPI
ncbi:GNAT family N-acetyltransferase [Streptomyces sp. NPDC090112]|uniref:GNAT family N-acetyltransferase n=1 Tax=Streptomyces sp. NPDC090112 TaxID=3365949 RepID=UPI003809C9B5